MSDRIPYEQQAKELDVKRRAKELALELRREGYVAVAVVLVNERHAVGYWTDAKTWGLAGSLVGGMHVAATGLAGEVDVQAIEPGDEQPSRGTGEPSR